MVRWRNYSIGVTVLFVSLFFFLTNASAAILQHTGNKIGNEGQLLQFTVIATTQRSGDTLVLTAENLPVGATFTQTANNVRHGEGVFSWTPNCDQAGIYLGVIFRARDREHPTYFPDSETITITINDVNVIFNPINDNSAGLVRIPDDSYSQKIVRVDDIDATVLGVTELYTVPVDKILVPTYAIVICTDDWGLLGTLHVSIGIFENYSEFIDETELPDLNYAGRYFVLSGPQVHQCIWGGETICLKIHQVLRGKRVRISVLLYGIVLDGV